MTPIKVQRKYPAYNNQGWAVSTLDIRAARCSEWVHPPEHETRHARRGRNESMNPEIEAAVVSIRENTNDRTARVNLRWEGKHQISDFALEKLGSVLNSEGEIGQNSGWAIVEVPAKATVGMTIPLLKEAK